MQDAVVAEEGSEDFKRRERAGGGDLVAIEFVEVKGVNALCGVSEVGVDLEAVEIADDE